MSHRSVFFGGGAQGEPAPAANVERQLTPEELRVLGCLIEKERITPDNYPLTLNSLVSACNQKSSRDPVVKYAERDIIQALDGLRELGLSVRVSSSDGGRVARYRQAADATLALRPPEIAVLGLLLLRGAQTVGEVRQRSERMHAFDSLDETQEALTRLCERGAGALAKVLARRAGEKEVRYVHTMGLVEDEPAAAPEEPASGTAPSPLATRVEALEAEVAALRAEFAEIRSLLE